MVRHEDIIRVLKDDLLDLYANPDKEENFSVAYLKKRIKDMEDSNISVTKTIKKQIEDSQK